MALGRLACAVLALAASGCLLADLGDPMGRMRALRESQQRYTQLVRWGEIEKAAELVDPAMRPSFLALAPAFEEIRITDYERGSFDFEGAEDTAVITVTYRGYSLATLVDQPVRERQEWYRSGPNTWLVRPQMQELVARFQGGSP
jgi:hypothetical protein